MHETWDRKQRPRVLLGDVQRLEYRYNQAGLIDRVRNVLPAAGMLGPSEQNFVYDQSDQMVSASGSFTGVSGDERRFTLAMSYDEIGRTTRMNQRDETLLAGGGAPVENDAATHDRTYAYGGPQVHAASTVGDRWYWYDANGNQSWRYDGKHSTWRSMQWDEEDRLMSSTEAYKTTAFVYDAGGSRTHKTGLGDTTLYPSAYLTIRASGDVSKHVWAGGERVGTVVRPAGGGFGDERAYWVHSDHLGGGQVVTTAGASVHEMNERLPYGEGWVHARAGSDTVAPGFAGMAHDDETGLDYHGARYYDAGEARWASRDPALEGNFAGGGVYDPRNLGLYAYAFNSPVSFWDPDGRQPVPRDGGTDPGQGDAAVVVRREVQGAVTCSRQSGISCSNTGPAAVAAALPPAARQATDRGLTITAAPNLVLPHFSRVRGNGPTGSDMIIQVSGTVPRGMELAMVTIAQDTHDLTHTGAGRRVRRPGYRSVNVWVNYNRYSRELGMTARNVLAPVGSPFVDNGLLDEERPGFNAIPYHATGTAANIAGTGEQVMTYADGPQQGLNDLRRAYPLIEPGGARLQNVTITSRFRTIVLLIPSGSTAENVTALAVGAVDWSATTGPILNNAVGPTIAMPQTLSSVTMSRVGRPLPLSRREAATLNRYFPGRIRMVPR
ncbi:MAG: RHS repeat-associated core domain-containing protein [Deltaproteobacteria bacterium]|nr:RHS repeat-associated core domain-containing protein [Deltaproteobacteria bacterium]